MSFKRRLGVARCRASKESICAWVCRDVFRERVTDDDVQPWSIVDQGYRLKQEYEQLSALNAPSRQAIRSFNNRRYLVKSNLVISAFHNEDQLPGSQENLHWDAKKWEETIVQKI